MVVFRVNAKILDVLERAKLEGAIVSHEDGTKTVAHDVIARSILLAGASGSLRSVLRNAELYGSLKDASVAHSLAKPRNPELEARLARIRVENENREYERMVKDVVRLTGKEAASEAARLGRLGSQMSIAANVIVTMATCFVAGYFVFKHSSGRESVGLAGGCACMIAAMLVECVLVITRLYSIDRAASRDVVRQTPGETGIVANWETQTLSEGEKS